MRPTELIKAYGISTNTQLSEFAKNDEIPLIEINFAENILINKDGAYIINLGESGHGTHWTGLWVEKKKALDSGGAQSSPPREAFYFDSYGVGPEDILIKKLKAYGIKDLKYNKGFEFQRYEEELCGMWVLMFFHYMDKNKKLPLEQRFKKMVKHYVDTL